MFDPKKYQPLYMTESFSDFVVLIEKGDKKFASCNNALIDRIIQDARNDTEEYKVSFFINGRLEDEYYINRK